MDRPWFRWVQRVAGIFVVVFLIRFMRNNWSSIRDAPLQWRVQPGWIVASLALIVATYGLLIAAWRILLTSWGARLSGRQAVRIWVLSSMGKYLPGKVWAVAGMAVMAQEAGVPPWAAAGSAILLQVMALGTGALLVAVLGLGPLEAGHPGSRLALAAIVVLSVAALVAVLYRPIAARLVRFVAKDATAVTTPSFPAIGAGLAANVIAWVVYGVSLWGLARGVLPEAPLSVRDSIAVFTASYLAGLLFLLAPGGLVVREAVFILMLEGKLGAANAVALAAVSRLAMTVADVCAAIPALLIRREPGGDRTPGP